MKTNIFPAMVLFLAIVGLCSTAQARDESEIAKQLANPVAALISVPIQANYDRDIGTYGGKEIRINIQPVIPFSLNENWNLISRTILPVIYQRDVPTIGSQDFGTGDTVQSFFFSPKKFTSGGLIWGVGPVFLLPTASENSLGGKKWGAGPTGVVLKQEGPWTYGVLANHIWSFAGDDERPDVSATFIQPFLCYITKTKIRLA